MSDILSKPARQTPAEQEATLNQIFAEMQRLNEQMQQDQADIDRIKVETGELKAIAMRYMAEAEHWQAESERLRHEGAILRIQTRAALDQLKATVVLGVFRDHLARVTLTLPGGYADKIWEQYHRAFRL